jgi:hypothetical protein
MATGVAAGDVSNASKLAVGGIQAPETAAAEYEFLHGNLNFLFVRIVPQNRKVWQSLIES